MLLRTSSAPFPSSLNTHFSQAEVCKDPSELPHSVHSSNLTSFQSVASPAPRQSLSSHGIYSGDDKHMNLASEQELGRGPQRRLPISRAQSEGDLACFSVAMAATCRSDLGRPGCESSPPTEKSRKLSGAMSNTDISSFSMKESILEEVDDPELLPPSRKSNNAFLQTGSGTQTGSLMGNNVSSYAEGFVLNDGEVYTGLKRNSFGSPVACNNKGCRPLTESECKHLGFLDMASGVGSDSFDWSHGDHRMDLNSECKGVYYQNLLKSDPENPFLLDNYAQYLMQKGEVKKSEEYFERAILADPSDGEVLSHYAKLQWDVNRDQDRAEAYFDRAVQAAPNDCYVMASYASFLWDVDNEETAPQATRSLTYGNTPPTSSPLLASA